MIPVRKFSDATELMNHYRELFDRERRKQEMILNERSARREEARQVTEPKPAKPRWPELTPLEKPKPDREPNTDVPAPLRRMSMVKHIKWQCVQDRFVNGEPMSVKDLEGDSRVKPVVEARQLAMYRCVRELGLSFPLVGRMFDRDHTTVMHAVRKVEARLQREQQLWGGHDEAREREDDL